MNKVLVILVVLAPAILAAVLNKEAVVSQCSDVAREELEPCLIKLINKMQPDFETGNPDWALEPMGELSIGRFDVSDYQNENSFLKMALWDILMKGLQELQVTGLKLDYASRNAHWEVEIPEIFVQAKYNIDARMSLIPIQGQGSMWGRLKEVRAKGFCKFDMKKDGDDYHLSVEGVMEDFDAKEVKLRLNGLYEDSPILKETAEAFVNDNGDEILKLIKPSFMHELARLITEKGNMIGATLSLKNLAGKQFLKEAFNL